VKVGGMTSSNAESTSAQRLSGKHVWPSPGDRAGGIPARPKMANAIVDALRLDIASGRLALGATLPSEKALAAHFGVSQPTVREAVRALEALGLLESRHGSGVYVTHSTGDFVTTTLKTLLQMERVSMLEAFEVRRTLGVFSAVKAGQRADETDVERFAAATEWCDNADTVPQIAAAVVEFQVAFSAAAHNPLLFALETFLIRLLMQFQLEAHRQEGVDFWRRRADGFREHRHAMITAMRAGDGQTLVDRWEIYLAGQQALFETDPRLSHISLSDPESIRTVDEIVLHMPGDDIGPR
jgi:GntR family transcriptional regulator, transcriptional repressor for pyruvate dehydrogenase complex